MTHSWCSDTVSMPTSTSWSPLPLCALSLLSSWPLSCIYIQKMMSKVSKRKRIILSISSLLVTLEAPAQSACKRVLKLHKCHFLVQVVSWSLEIILILVWWVTRSQRWFTALKNLFGKVKMKLNLMCQSPTALPLPTSIEQHSKMLWKNYAISKSLVTFLSENFILLKEMAFQINAQNKPSFLSKLLARLIKMNRHKDSCLVF